MERYEKSPFFRMVLLRGEEREEGRRGENSSFSSFLFFFSVFPSFS